MSAAEPVEINFDGIVGPSHNYAGLSIGNLAASGSAGRESSPRAAALEGVGKMRAAIALGLRQGVLLPHPRPDDGWLAAMGAPADTTDASLIANASSASAMWAANAATVSPAADTKDAHCHLSVANLLTMPHRAIEAPHTLAQLRLAFAHPAFRVHGPVPAPFGDEGAANHMRLADGPGAPGVEIFVYGVAGGAFPARQHEAASRAVARRHGLDPDRTLFWRQSDAAIGAGAFHNDVVAVADGRTLFAHEHAFADPDACFAALRAALPSVEIVTVPADRVSLADAVRSYLFNAQLVTEPGTGSVLLLPAEAREVEPVRRYLDSLVTGNGPIRAVRFVDVRESMANGGGPACLRLRVLCDPAAVDPRFLVDDARLDRIAAVIERHWPERIAPAMLGDPALRHAIRAARLALLAELDLSVLA